MSETADLYRRWARVAAQGSSPTYTYRRLWELRATTWLMQSGHHSREAARETEVRLQSWRSNDPDTRWSGVLERNATDIQQIQ